MIVIGRNVLNSIPDVCGSSGNQFIETGLEKSERVVLIVYCQTTHKLFSKTIKDSFSASNLNYNEIVCPDGESAKDLSQVQMIWNKLNKIGAARDSVVVAVGGGTIGDVAGFAASTYMRGIKLIQVPTTLLAMVDSSIGGKTAINLPIPSSNEGDSCEVKNLIGSFHIAKEVLMDLDCLQSLPEKEYKNGLAEIAKAALLDGWDFYNWLLENADELNSRRDGELEEAINRSVSFKLSIVEQDATEQDLRVCLNFGHTLAHAIETVTNYEVSHGKAVVTGMKFSTLLEDAAKEEIEKLLFALELESFEIRNLDENELINVIGMDKKKKNNHTIMVLLSGVGNWKALETSDDILKKCLEDFK